MASKVALGEMKRLEPRTVWPHEEQDFTPWLYENLGKLGEALGLELEGQERECDLGDFAVDIVARELGGNRVVVIENQLEATDHKHLGQLLTYAAGKEAGVVVWISPEFRDEHREALDWLNCEGGEGRPEFFGIEIQVIQIDDSSPAVNLRPVAFPNDWTRDLNERPTGEVSEKRQKYLAFFQGLLDDLREQKFGNAKKAQPQNWYAFSSGVKGYVYGASFAKRRTPTGGPLHRPPGRLRHQGGIRQAPPAQGRHREGVRGRALVGKTRGPQSQPRRSVHGRFHR